MLSRREQRSLTQYSIYRENPPTFLRIAFRYFFLSPYFFVHALLWGFAYLSFEEVRQASYLAIGLSLGMIGRDLGMILQFVRNWPMFNAIFDWDKVDELLKYGSLSESE